MFEFSLENGKKQLRQGLLLLIGVAILATIIVIVAYFAKNTGGAIAIAILSICLAVIAILSSIKVIFGSVVYHAERTASKTTQNTVPSNQ